MIAERAISIGYTGLSVRWTRGSNVKYLLSKPWVNGRPRRSGMWESANPPLDQFKLPDSALTMCRRSL